MSLEDLYPDYYDDDAEDEPATTEPPTMAPEERLNRLYLIIGIPTGLAVVLFFALIIMLLVKRRRREQARKKFMNQPEQDTVSPGGSSRLARVASVRVDAGARRINRERSHHHADSMRGQFAPNKGNRWRGGSSNDKSDLDII